MTLSSSDVMSLQSYTADYWPGMNTTALSVVHVNADFFKDVKERLPVLVRLLSSKRGLNFLEPSVIPLN